MGSLQLRTWFIALIAVGVLPSFFILQANYRSNQATTLERAITTMKSVAGLAAATHKQSVEGVRQILGTVSSGPSVRRYDLEHLCWEFIGNVADASPSYSQLGVLTLDGTPRCLPPNAPIAPNLGDRTYFRQAITTQKFTVGEYVLGRLSGRKALTYAVPVYDYGNQLKGVAYVGLDLGLVDQRFKELTLDPSIQVSLLSDTGLLLASTHASEEAIGSPLADEVVQRLLRDQLIGSVESAANPTGRSLYLLTPTEKSGVSKPSWSPEPMKRKFWSPG